MLRPITGFACLGLLCGPAQGQNFFCDFEPPEFVNGPLTGQQDWYNPVPGGSDGLVLNGPGFGLSQNPGGATQRAVSYAPGGIPSASQVDVAFVNTNYYFVAYDFVNRETLNPAVSDHISTLSLNHPSLQQGQFRGFEVVNRFLSAAEPTNGSRAAFNVFDSTGAQMVGVLPGPSWDALAFNTWYRHSIEINFLTNSIVSVTLTNRHTGATTTAYPTGWYLDGGASSSLPIAAALRLSGAAFGNVTGWDNFVIVPAPVTWPLALAALLFGPGRRR